MMTVQMRQEDEDDDRPSVQDRMIEAFEPGSLPPMAPGGAPALDAVQPFPDDPPRICEVGPCSNYHRFETQLDAQNPMDVGRHGRSFHVKVHYYCYPDVGVDTELGTMPVLECNRWSPPFSLIRPKWLLRRRHARDLEEWNAQREAVQEALALNAPVPLVLEFAFASGKPDDYATYEWDYKPEQALDEVVTNALTTVGFFGAAKDPDPAKRNTVQAFTWTVADEYGNAFDNLTATVGELGLESGAKLIVTLTDKDNPPS